MAPKSTATDLRTKSREDLQKTLDEYKNELFQLRIAKVTGQGGNVGQMRSVRRTIARIITIMNEQSRTELRKLYKDEKFIPVDLREKSTRAMRNRIPKSQSKLKTRRERVRAKNFPMRK
eukprot:CAMPEP_0117450778 /NCGR_PEP_ID=MMETSP0759-20121206/8650_1 /TAXON_ID=63605 /ORGANISM="Percolomonas cosmopolitus, Strain WS" /LENGTH=118 /DNA_ID=CAMNT_0005243323 /DNA_START=43 /DNA_END=396 /DNA_ORIENTATION=+